MGISRHVALGSLLALSSGWLGCSGEDDGTGKGTGAATSAGNGGAAGSGTLAVGGRAGGGSGGSAGAAGEQTGGSAGGSAFCLPAMASPTPAVCDGTAPKNVAAVALQPMPIVVQLPTLLPLPNRPDTFAVRGRGTQVPLVIGRIDAGIATWVVSPDSPAWGEITAATFLGDDLWVASSYTPHRLWRCTIADDLTATCGERAEFPHGHSNGTMFAVPPGSCDHPEGALLDIDTTEDGAPETALHDAHLYDVKTGTWSLVPRPTRERRDLSQVIRLRDGRALFVGGQDAVDSLATTEIFDGKTITAGPTLAKSRYGQGMALFPDGRVLVTGGYARDQELPGWEIVDVFAGGTTLSPQPPANALGRAFAAATGPFGNCGYVSLGGRNADKSAAIDYFAFDKPGFERLASPVLPAPVEYAAAVTLTDGSLVYVGGRTPATDSAAEGAWHGNAFRVFAP